MACQMPATVPDTTRVWWELTQQHLWSQRRPPGTIRALRANQPLLMSQLRGRELIDPLAASGQQDIGVVAIPMCDCTDDM